MAKNTAAVTETDGTTTEAEPQEDAATEEQAAEDQAAGGEETPDREGEGDSQEEDSGIDWMALLDDEDQEGESPSEKRSPEEAQAGASEESDEDEGEEPDPAPVEKAQKPSPADRSSEADSGEVTQQPKPVAAEQRQQPQQPKPMTAEEQEELRQRREQYLLARYGITEEDGERLLSDPHKELPRLLARVHDAVLSEAQNLVSSQIEPAVTRTLSEREQTQRVERKFFERWKPLNKPEYRADLVKLAQAFRQAFPDADEDSLIRDVGMQAMIRFGLDPREGAESGEETAAETKSKPKPKAEAEVGSTAFRPASPKASAPGPARGRRNQFEQLADEIIEDDDEYG